MRLEVLRIAAAALTANVMRSVLTTLGIVIGVAAVIAMIALGNGAQASVKDRIATLGTTILQIDAVHIRQGGVQQSVTKKMTIDDAREIEERALHVVGVEPQQDKQLQVVWRDRNASVSTVGVTPNFLQVRHFELALGAWFGSADDLGRARVAVLGGGVAELLGVQNPAALIGQEVRIAGVQFTVIGILKTKGTGSSFGNLDDQVYVPFGTGRFRLFKTDRVDDIFALASSEADLPLAMSEIQLAMRRAHRIPEGAPDDFRIRNQADVLQTLSEATQVFTTLLAGIAGVSLLVGGIGIMNIMLVSVTERTREIGIRKALGATRRNILFQFLTEALALCLVGGMIGIAVGVGGAEVLRQSFGWTTAIGPSSIVLAFLFAAAVGIVFGVWPARRASSLDPIEALRYE
ncbi:MAG TPA: ABC transporter permease [Gemmatimonadaceae bacterium]|nr:ABC transporter permease [Gemmatimonadaceae bacterium]